MFLKKSPEKKILIAR